MGKLINSNRGSIRSFPNGGHGTPYGAKDDMGGDSGWYPEEFGWAPTGSRATGGPVSKLKSVSRPRSMHEGGAVKLTSKPILRLKPRRNMANGGVAKAKPASRSECCRGNSGRTASRPTPRPISRPISRPAPLSGGSRGRGAR